MSPRPQPPPIIVNPPDIRLVQSFRPLYYSVTVDWDLLLNGALDDRQALCTAVVVALGTDALAAPDDVLPDPDDTDRAGWWGDMDAGEIWNGWPIGTKLWLMRRSGIFPMGYSHGATQALIVMYIRDSLQPFVDRKICTSFEVISARVDKQRIDALVRMFRGPKTSIDLQYQILWDGIIE